MTVKNEERKDLTGLETTATEKGSSKKDSEYNLTAALLQTAAFKNSEEAITEVEIKRGGNYMFTLHIHPISDADARKARKRATTYMPNPNNRKLPPIEKEFDSARFHSQLIYMATTEEDRQNIWNNVQIKEQYNVLDPVDSIDVLLLVGEKLAIVDTVMDISGMDEDEISPEEYAKN